VLSGHRRLRLYGNPLATLRRRVIGTSSLRHNDTPLRDYPEPDWVDALDRGVAPPSGSATTRADVERVVAPVPSLA
jgi:hypothetical protein